MQNNTVKFNLDLNLYPLDVIYQACYVFLDRAYVFLDSPSPQKVSVIFKGKEKFSRKNLESLKGEFHNELSNSALRKSIAQENRKIREAIIGRALFSAIEGETKEKKGRKMDFQKDKLGIAVPWEEKYGKKKKAAKKLKGKKVAQRLQKVTKGSKKVEK